MTVLRCCALFLLAALVAAPDAVSTAQDKAPQKWKTRAKTPDSPPGWWSVARQPLLSEEERESVEQLRSLGYIAGGAEAPGAAGVTIHDTAGAWQGLNLYVSGDFPGARLIDMEGRVVHEWRYDFLDAWPDRQHAYATDTGSRFWFHAHLFENGDIIGVFNDQGLVKVDKDSRLIWKYGGGSHHHLHVAEDGRIYSITHRDRMAPRISSAVSILEDAVTVLDADGNELDRVSLLDAFWGSDYASTLKEPPARAQGQLVDLFHANRIVPIGGRLAETIPAFREGEFLLSLRNLNTLAVLDMDTESIVWALSGFWLQQHCPSILEGNTVLLFDNQGNYGWTRILEFDPATQEIVWSYTGGDGKKLYAPLFGTAQRLPNGNTLIAESHYGRAVEVTPGGEVVWEFLNPARAGEDNELVANLFEIERIPESDVEGWLNWK